MIEHKAVLRITAHIKMALAQNLIAGAIVMQFLHAL